MPDASCRFRRAVSAGDRSPESWRGSRALTGSLRVPPRVRPPPRKVDRFTTLADAVDDASGAERMR
jgi:hypothetical protein